MPTPMTRTYERATQLMEAELGDELVALDVAQGSCFGFNEAAASVWRQLAQPRSFEQLRAALLDEYEVSEEECGRDLAELLDEMTRAGLVRAVNS